MLIIVSKCKCCQVLVNVSIEPLVNANNYLSVLLQTRACTDAWCRRLIGGGPGRCHRAKPLTGGGPAGAAPPPPDPPRKKIPDSNSILGWTVPGYLPQT